MNIYKHKETGRLYKINHLCLDIEYFGDTKRAGVYPIPYKHFERLGTFYSKDELKCEQWIKHNFEIVKT